VGDVCPTAEVLTPGTLASPLSVTGTTVNYANDYSDTNQSGCIGTSGRDRVYSVAMPTGARLLANIRQSSVGSYDPSINLIVGPASQCAASPRVCVAGDDLDSSSVVNSVRYLNTSGSAQTLFVLADSISSLDQGGGFRLDVSVDVPSAGDACETPIALTSGTPRSGESFTGLANDYFVTSRTSGSGCVTSTASAGPDRAYSVLVGAGETLNVTVTPAAGLDTAINLHADASECASRTCTTSANTGGSGANDTLQWTNTGTSARTMLLVVESPTGATGSFSITTTTGTLPGDVCATTAPPVTVATTLSAQSLSGYSVDYSQTSNSNGCLRSSGPDRVYAVTVPPRQRLVTTVSPTSGMDPVINIINGVAAACSATPRVCSGSADGLGSGGVETAVWDNGTTTPQNAFVVVSGYAPFSSVGTFTWAAQFLVGDSCRSPTLLAGPFPQTLSAQTFVGYRRDITLPFFNFGGCLDFSGPERVYQITVPPTRRLRFTATSSADLVLNAFTSESTCTASSPTCVSAADQFSSGPEIIDLTNNGSTAATLWIAVSAANGPTTATYSVTASLQ